MSCDKLIFHAPGICPHCQMALIPASEQYTRSKEDQVTQLLKAYNYDTVPGLALGIIKHGELIFAKGYGSANLDYEIPNTPNSRFYIGSMAKQFTGAALVKLSSEGKIDFHAPIQTYLPDFPVYDHPITVQHIIHHTSGIRGTSSMQLIAGIEKNFEEYFSANMQYEMIKAQKSLNFIPGSEYRYSSGGYIILAKVVEAISGISFREYLNIHFFQPLGMDQTFVIDDHQEVVKDRVISYFPTHSGEFKRRSMIFDGMGDGSILTTVSDLAKWDRAFYEDALLHIPQFAARMYEVGILNSG
ncbi:MAG: serine hydrolase, partial [Bacteroidota bacterium]